MTERIQWPAIVARAAVIVDSYDTGVTLRQLFYRLVSEQLLPNTQTAYKGLSKVTAEARRQGTFPALLDRTRTVHRLTTFDGADQARGWLKERYRRDRTEGQEWAIYLGVEKHGLVEQLRGWFDVLGVPILALGGYSSQSFVDEVAEQVADENRTSVLLYGGDFDPSGEDIPRDFIERAAVFDEVVQVALTEEQVIEYDLPPAMGKATDSRASQFMAKHGRLVQVEIDALPPDTLEALFSAAIENYWDMSTYDAVIERETAEREDL